MVCPACKLASWIALDNLKQLNVCDLCGNAFDATNQLVNGVLSYRRTGVLRLERNNQGAAAVALVLQHLNKCIGLGSKRQGHFIHLLTNAIYGLSYDLVPPSGNDLRPCEVDFLMIFPRAYPGRAEIILGECKDEGGKIGADDVENLRRIVKMIPAQRFDTFIVFAKLAPFTQDEIALANKLTVANQRSVILLAVRELEQDAMHLESARDLAQVTAELYFAPLPPEPTTPHGRSSP
jgi:hypothetical protein